MLPSISWYLVLQVFGLVALPLTWRLFGRLPGRGYPFAKPLGLLLVSYVLWLGASFRLLPNDVGGILAALGLVAGVSAWLGREGLVRHPGATARPLIAWLRDHWPTVLTTELLFLLVFAGWTAFRAFNPEIAGTEKPMELAFINGVLGSRFFPPQDPWLSGYAISYYYFGYVMLAVLIRLAAVDPAVGFNLGVSSWYALTMIAAFGVAYELVALRGGSKLEAGSWKLEAEYGIRNTQYAGRPIRYGLLAALFVGFLANLEGLVELAYHRSLLPMSWIQWLDIKQLTDTPPSGGLTGGFWWWWRASRVIHDKDLLGNSIEVIDEFPFFSFLLGDMHPHVLGLPFALLAIALALNLLLGARDWVLGIGDRGSGIQSLIPNTWQDLAAATGLGAWGVFLYALALGGLGFLNTWDFPIYVGLAALALGVGLAWGQGLSRQVVGRAAGGAVLLAVLGWLLYLPFYIGFQSQLGGILPNLLFPTRLRQYGLMFGPFLLVVLFFLLLLSRAASTPKGREADESAADPLPSPALILRKTLALLPWTLLAPALFLALFFVLLTALPPGRQFLDSIMENPAVAANIGGRTPAELLGLVLRVRAAAPWTYLFLAGVIAWAGGVLWARLSVLPGRPVTASPGHRVTDSFAVLLIGLGLLLTFAVEFVYLRDLFGTRMNTVFKFYYQAWAMLALAAAYGLSRLAERATPAALKLPAWILAAVLVAGGLFYPLAAIPSKADNFRPRPTLDGLAYLRQNNPADMAAIEWIRANVPPDAVVVESTGGSYSPEGAGRVSMATGNPTLLGWDFHERQWRGAAYDRLAAGRPEALEQIFRTARAEDLPALLNRWDVDYVFIGGLERRKYGIGDAALARFDRVLRRVYDRDGVRIYAR